MTAAVVGSKARRLLWSGAVHIELVSPNAVRAVVVGDSGRWVVRYLDGPGWTCTCPAGDRGRACSHVAAVELVTTPRETTP